MITNNETESLILNHRSVRDFKEQPIDDERVDNLLALAQHTANSQFMQSYSVIRIKDRNQLSKMTQLGNHDFNAGEELVIFIADQKRNVDLALKAGESIKYLTNFDRFLAGFYDATLAAQTFSLAAESEGLGSLMMTSFLDNTEEMIAALELPQYTFPVMGVVIGEALEVPELKPRLRQPLIKMTDKYQAATDYDEQMVAYDQQVFEYYNTRTGSPRQEKFSNMIARFAGHGNPKRDNIFKMIKQQGFKVE